MLKKMCDHIKPHHIYCTLLRRRKKKCVIYVCSLAGLVLLICIFIFKFKFLLNHGFSPKYISRAGPLSLFSALIADTDAVKLYLKLKTFLVF